MCEEINPAEAICKIAVALIFFIWIIRFLKCDKNGK